MNSIFSSQGTSKGVQNNQAQMIEQFNNFKNSFKGNPKQVVMNMLKNGQITNPQLQQVIQMAQQLKGILK